MRSPFNASSGVALPVARLVSSEPSAAAVRWVMRAAWLMMLLFAVVVVFGHVPPA